MAITTPSLTTRAANGPPSRCTLATAISAKKGTNVQELLDQILLQAEILDLKANPTRRASGTVIEAQLDPGKGPVATVLIQNGTLHVG